VKEIVLIPGPPRLSIESAEDGVWLKFINSSGGLQRG
jgi:hypothetical protein